MLESLCRLPVEVDLGSEFRYRDPFVDPETLLITISQSGETTDTLAGLREAKPKGAHYLAICNAVDCSIVRDSEVSSIPMPGRKSAWPPLRLFSRQGAPLPFRTESGPGTGTSPGGTNK